MPSATEIVCALGLDASLVGISHDCDYPPHVLDRPVLSEAIVTTDLPSGMIEARIRGQIHKGKSVYHLDEAQLRDLRPDLILTQELCSVCAPSYSLVQEAAKILESETRIVSLEPRGLEGILDNILLVGELTGTGHTAGALVRDLRARIDAIRARTAGAARPRTVCLEWFEPIYVAGHWLPEMVKLAGGTDVLGRSQEPSYVVEWETIVQSQPEVVVLMPCGFDIPRAKREVHLIAGRPGWSELPAVRSGAVYVTDGSAYFNRPGPRIVDGLEVMAHILHPDLVDGRAHREAVERL